MRTPRQAARVAFPDSTGSVFLFRYDDEEVGVHWAMPGGGLNLGESPRQTAERELREESGWTDIEVPGAVLFLWEHDFTRAGVPVRQHEEIFLARGPRRDPVGDVAAAHAADRIIRWQWWSPGELSAGRELTWPPQLGELLAVVRESGAPPGPVDLGYVPNGAVSGG
ncbi:MULTISPECIES: NUDIX hydrolase [Streptomyces]|uniref:NUDIX hydrolase n=1 Tax=Streptomyces TaxID=1883 RepID=UPI0004CD3939|nr:MULTISPECIES: NUDIX domain-containing protein [Streptomyces]KOT54129.1 NUDIX hydrolase [Streptomyces rimosus subsp. rimosus]